MPSSRWGGIRTSVAKHSLVNFHSMAIENLQNSQTEHRPGVMFGDLHELLQTGATFPTIYADPPWEYQNSASRAAACNHYSTMSLKEICAMPIERLAAENAHLHLWATNPLFPLAFDVIAAWGFSYRACFVWTKEKTMCWLVELKNTFICWMR